MTTQFHMTPDARDVAERIRQVAMTRPETCDVEIPLVKKKNGVYYAIMCRISTKTDLEILQLNASKIERDMLERWNISVRITCSFSLNEIGA